MAARDQDQHRSGNTHYFGCYQYRHNLRVKFLTGIFYFWLMALMAVMGPVIAQAQSRPIADIMDCAWQFEEDANFCRSTTMRAAEAEVARLATAARTAGPMWWSVTSNQKFWEVVHRNPQAKVNDLHHAYALKAMELREIASGVRRRVEMKVSRDELVATCVVPAHLEFESFAKVCKAGEVIGVAPVLIAQKG
jgi:hypothetical protein